MRYFLAVLVMGIGLAAAAAVLVIPKEEECPNPNQALEFCEGFEQETRRPSWTIPVAILVGFVGVGAGIGIAASGRN